MQPIDYDSVAELYDLYVTADYDVPFFLSEVRSVEGPVLELMSGTGRLSLPLIEAGTTLTCVDASRGMLDLLERKLAARGLTAEVHCLDVRRLDLPGRYELVLLPFQSFMEIVREEDQRAALSAIAGILAPGGRFLCTLHNPEVRRRQVDGLLRLVGRFPAGDGTLVVSGFEQGGRPVVSRLQLFEMFGPNGRMLWKRLLPMEFTLVEREAFEQMALDAGFSVLRLYGSYDRAPFDAERSPVMIWELSRNPARIR